MLKTILLLGLCVSVVGCGSPDMYSWGRYEKLVYGMYRAPGKVTPSVQVEHMLKDLEKARSKSKTVPPGFHAHLGYLYNELGQLELARAQFEAEKNLYPESAKFMDRLISNTN